MSNQIRSLEDHFRVPLFTRSKTSITLTEAGAALHEKVRSILGEVDDLEREMRDFRQLERGSVRLAVTSSFGNHLLPGVIAGFRRRHPKITVAALVDHTDRVWEMIEGDEAELAVTTAQPPTTRRVTVEPFVTDDLVLITPAALPVPVELTATTIASLPLVLREEGSLTLTVMRELLDGLALTVAAQLSGTAAVNEAVAAGVGVSLVPQSSTGAWEDAGLVRVHRLPELRLHHEYVLVHAPQRYQSSAAKALLDHLRAWAAEARP